jgi:hypothetical protein
MFLQSKQTSNHEKGATIMTKNPKTKRTQLKDLAVNEQELSGKEMAQVQGGSNLNDSKCNITAAIVPPPLSPSDASKKMEPPKVDKSK